ncbi:acyl-CoA dehydrogenase family protein [Pyxidicoccus parkwayensis]|uniref:Acyl-CoA dehydrogenase family protein n=1 Tax=Pyxidicoccus parkwayensis TaxID=2813578 RepID=A0ABX7NMX6_9BACT|nr:acyl-CoA dehydrogenase family protein [Pyxidicoccus parkwaysis]QSQ18751.1 acyl-CoA dehydrogenase family protein [Pyxidicoccus parkwaysis]
MNDVLHFLLSESPEPQALDSVDAWWLRHLELMPRFTAPADLALAGGFRADRLGFAFASGYHAAHRSLFPMLPGDKPCALCATEPGGAHPSAIQTKLTDTGSGWKLSGAKTFVTLGTRAELLLVVATEGQDAQGRNRLRMVAVDAKRSGVHVAALPELPFVPEIPHAELTLEDVAVASNEVLPGDGYARYLKPFRTVEDCHVHLAALGWLFQVARRSGWPEPLREELLALAVMMRGLAQADPADSTTHLALGGALALAKQAIEKCEPLWAQTDATTRERWARDKKLLDVAGKVRAKRLEAARQRASGSKSEGP